ncbi:MAG TPA: type IV secretory system conjugative DNA transfer family protein [Rickettsiales bacterium]|nr:type IV secretory system conjugative DNA transfer family protein [Rickettsiales bacterium]
MAGNLQNAIGTKIVVLFIILLVLIGPLYLSGLGIIYWNYGYKYMQACANSARYLETMLQYLFNYWYTYHTNPKFPGEFTVHLFGPPVISLFFSLTLLYMMRAPLIDFRPFKKKESLHGDAHWATESEIKAAKLRAKKGLLLGRTGLNRYLIADDFQHVLLFAPTGSGKGVGFVLPNLVFWQGSMICHDIKGENHELTSGYREKKMGQKVFMWNPADPEGRTHCYNPLDWISSKPGQMVDDVQKICNLILPEQEFWQNEARSLLLGVILYLYAVPEKPCSFGEVVRTMRSDDVVYSLAVVLDTIGKRIHPVSYMNIAAFLQKADKERSGVVSTLNSGLELWANPLIDTATASSDFDLQQLKKQLISVYCAVTPDNLQRLEPLLKVFYQQATDFLTRKMPGKDEPHGVLFLMDEFPTLGEMKQFQTGIAYFRGYRVKLFLIVQDTQQLKGIYEDAGMNSFLSNSYYRITFSANNIETAKLISELVGNKTVKQYSKNIPKFLDFDPKSRTMNESEVQRALLLPQEVITLPRDEQIILIESTAPIKTKKIFYYQDSFFTSKVFDPKNPKKSGPPTCFVPTQEPYDPRKHKKAAPKEPEKPQSGGGGGGGGKKEVATT